MANANMKFKADLLPNTDLGYNLGDSSHRWNIYGDLTGNASSATSAKALASFATIGATSSNHALALQTYFNNNKSSIPRNQLINFYDSTNGNGSTTFGYFLSGYDSNPYGGFYVAHYNTPYYVGISNGNYIEQTLLTSTNYNSYTVKKDGTGASGTWEINISGNAATATKASYVEGTNDAANPGGALLRSGSGRADASPAGDTWIYWDTLGGTTNYWGIRHNQGANTIGFYGGGNERVTISMGESKVTATTFAGKATSAGTADKISNITTADAANSSDTWRNVWISYSDNATGRPAYDTDLAYQTSTDTLKSSKYQLKNKARMEYNDTTNAIDFIFL